MDLRDPQYLDEFALNIVMSHQAYATVVHSKKYRAFNHRILKLEVSSLGSDFKPCFLVSTDPD